MSVTNEVNKVSYVASGATSYTIPFYFEAASHIKLYVNNILKTVSTDYTVSGALAPAGGTLTIVGTPPVSPSTITIVRIVPLSQLNTFNEGGPFQAKTLEKMFDKDTHIAQQINEKADRSFKVPVSSTINPELTGTVVGGGMLIFNDAGTALTTGPNAVTYVAGAATSATNASTSAGQASTSASSALASKNAASTSETNSASSASSALASKNSASTSETNSASNASSALASKNAAATSETNSAASATSALASKNAAATSETNSAASANSALTSKNAAATSETNSAASANSALTSKNAAATSETNAANSAASAAASSSLTAKGDLLSHNGTANTRLPVGTNSQLLMVDSTQATGIKWGNKGLITDLVLQSKTANYTVLNTDELVMGDATTAAITFTLPTAVGISGRELVIKKIDPSANAVTIDGAGTETIDGELTLLLRSSGDQINLISNGANWVSVNRLIKVAARAVQSFGQSLPNAANTVITWNASKIFDTHGAFNPSTGLFTSPESGYYQVNSRVAFESIPASTNYDFIFILNKNGTDYSWGDRKNGLGSAAILPYVYLGVSDIVFLAKGETVSVAVFHQNTGAAKAMGSNTLLNYISITKTNVG